MDKPIFLEDLADIVYSAHGSIQTGVLYDVVTGEDVDGGTVDYLIDTYPKVEVLRILAMNDDLVFYINVDHDEMMEE